jgi:hypothetical protein
MNLNNLMQFHFHHRPMVFDLSYLNRRLLHRAKVLSHNLLPHNFLDPMSVFQRLPYLILLRLIHHYFHLCRPHNRRLRHRPPM